MSIQNKISTFDVSEPYVWRMRLSESDFCELESRLSTLAAGSGVSALAKEDNAVATVIYIAEWYKRRYQAGNKCEIIDGLDIESLWEAAGISKKKYLYVDDSGSKRWLYSLYVLGGLAIQHELNRNDNMRFLKGLCRLYHGENYTLENLDEASRAVAFRESIRRQHSLYEYMREILNGDMPFDAGDLEKGTSDVNRFVETIKAANDEILRVKFRFEWVVRFSPDFNNMTRRLNVWFKPEEVGGGLHQYLRYDRVHLWGIPNPETKQHLYVYVRFKNGEAIVEESTMSKPLLTYLNHGVNDFVAFGAESGAVIRNIPSYGFDKIELVVKDDDGNEYLAQSQDMSDYAQLWRVDPYGDWWSTTQNTQKQTALLFSNRCHLTGDSAYNEVVKKRFSDPLYGMSETWNWVYIYDSVSFADAKGKEFSLYNRIGYDQVTTRLHSDTIRYVGGGKIRHVFVDDPDVSEIPDIEEHPVIFGRDDIVVRHFATKDDVVNAQPEEDVLAESVEWKNEKGRYIVWDELSNPPYGENTFRVTIKGKSELFKAVYLPELDAESPVRRDYYSSCVRYRNLENEVCTIQDDIRKDGIELFPTLPVRYGYQQDYYEIDVYRPTLLKEVVMDGRIINYLDGDQKLSLPYIFKDRVKLNDFSIHGYQSYECKHIGSIYTDVFLSIENNPNSGWAALAAWSKNSSYHGRLLDAMAPESLVVCFGLPRTGGRWEGHEALRWNYDINESPCVADPSDKPDFGIIYQNLSKNLDLICNFPIQCDDDPWGFDDVEASVLRCFEAANEAGTYFFIMRPLIDLKKQKIMTELYEPLLEARDGILTEKDKVGLLRFAEEFCFDWNEFKVNIEIQ